MRPKLQLPYRFCGENTIIVKIKYWEEKKTELQNKNFQNSIKLYLAIILYYVKIISVWKYTF